MTTTAAGYGRQHQLARREYEAVVLSGRARCVRCGERIRPGEPWHLDHAADRRSYLGPSHAACNIAASNRKPVQVVFPLEPDPEPEGLPWTDSRFDVPWLRGLRRPPADASWPRLMSVPHRRAVGSLGSEFVAWSERMTGGRLRWWQRLAAARILEVDADGRLCWETVILSMPRQLGKSWLLRELALWRIHQADRFAEQQNVMHIGNVLDVCMEVQRPARVWAQQRPEYQVLEANGKERIVRLECGSRWIVKSKDRPYGFAVSLALVDEGWDVKLAKVEEGLEPTMAEREQPQLLLVSTAHRLTTSLMLSRRRLALSELEDGAGSLLLEWSAPRGSRLDDRAAWRAASASWTPRREELLERRLVAALENTIDDPTEPDPVASFRAQWLNEWPPKIADPTGNTEDLLPPGLWADRAEAGIVSSGPVWVAVETSDGFGAAVAVAGRLDDGRIEVDGWLCRDWDAAVESVEGLGRPVKELLVGATMIERIPMDMVPRPKPAVSTMTRAGLALIRDLVATGQIVHEQNKPTNEIDETFAVTQVRTTMSGLIITASPAAHLVKAVVWAVAAAHKPTKTPAIR